MKGPAAQRCDHVHVTHIDQLLLVGNLIAEHSRPFTRYIYSTATVSLHVRSGNQVSSPIRALRLLMHCLNMPQFRISTWSALLLRSWSGHFATALVDLGEHKLNVWLTTKSLESILPLRGTSATDGTCFLFRFPGDRFPLNTQHSGRDKRSWSQRSPF